METTTCNLCGANHVSELYTVPDLLLDRAEITARLVQCIHCGLVYQNPRPTLTEIGQHYPPEYEPYIASNIAQGQSWLIRQAVAYGMAKRRRFVTRYKRAGRLLDIGCATGTFLHNMQGHGSWNVCGVELSEDAAQLARQEFGLDVFTGTLEQAAYPDKHFDVVTMWDVLEHLHDPLGSLLEVRRILDTDGILLVRVPNLASWDARLFGATWAGLDAPRHLYIFTPHTLSTLLERAGFTVLEHNGGIGSYVTFVLSVRFWMRAKGLSSQTQARITRLLYSPAARLLSGPFFYLSSALLRAPLVVTIANSSGK